ncbi:hypothetical protein SSX86_008405 [Deinandra increscens subsp. villosa]|uniref:RRM domain-containing protein n=1 Tax=Deinandra increscens subsp. villosa TaxID=3103831 RepID=A0AAP0DBM3_9ASTR
MVTSAPPRVSPEHGGTAEASSGVPWQIVQNRKSKSTNHQVRTNSLQNRFLPRNNQNQQDLRSISTSFYICNFNPSLTNLDLWKRCERWGTVTDVYIAKHLLKAGHRFGFVRFRKVNDIDAMLLNLRSMWCGTYHVFADVARFSKPEVKKPQPKTTRPHKVYVEKSSASTNVLEHVKVASVNVKYVADPSKLIQKPLNKTVVITKELLNPFINSEQIVLAKMLDVTSLVRLFPLCNVEGFEGSQGEGSDDELSSNEEVDEQSVEDDLEGTGDNAKLVHENCDVHKLTKDIREQVTTFEDPFSAYRIITDLEKN